MIPEPNRVRLIPAIRQTLRWLDPIYPGRRLGLAAIAICLIVGLIGLPATAPLLLIGLGLLAYFAFWLYSALIERTIVDFHQRRAELLRLGLPGKRGVLFYGPPGTGKTYTCKYIASRLDSATTLVVTGHALLHMKAICAIAKMLQPTLVLLEDVDLVFAHRENNAYNTVLGEFIDQLDGFGDTDQIIFILTTNAIERVESAIKDRPGRVSQAVYFGPPNATLRRRYLDNLLRPYDAVLVNVQRLVSQTDGVSQAFLKELVFRAIQLASGQNGHQGATLSLLDEHFETALHDMTTGSGRASHRIIGFRMEAER